MSRSSWKNFSKISENVNNVKNQIKISKRNLQISSKFLNKKVSIYNGKTFINIFIDQGKVGYKFGEFAYTRKICVHKVKNKNKK